MAAIPGIIAPANPFEFLSRACVSTPGHVSKSMSSDSGFCLNCPELYPSLALAQAEANKECELYAPGNYGKNRGKVYCGNNPYIKKWTSYLECYGREGGPHAGFQNPFYYARLGTGAECFNNGRNAGNLQNARRGNNAPRPNRAVAAGVADQDQDNDIDIAYPVAAAEEEAKGPQQREQEAQVPARNNRQIRRKPRKAQNDLQPDDRFDFKEDENEEEKAVHDDFSRRAEQGLFNNRYSGRARANNNPRQMTNQQYADQREAYFNQLQTQYRQMRAAQLQQQVESVGLLYTNKFNGVRDLAQYNTDLRFPPRR